MPTEERISMQLESSDPAVRALAPQSLFEANGCAAIGRLKTLLEKDPSPVVREAAFHQTAAILALPQSELDQQFVSRGEFAGLRALQQALLSERDTGALIEMLIDTKKLAQDNPRAGEQLAHTLLSILHRDRHPGDSIPAPELRNPLATAYAHYLLQALVPVVDRTLDTSLVLKIADAANLAMEKDGAVPGGRPGPNYDRGIRPLLLHLQTRKEDMGIRG